MRVKVLVIVGLVAWGWSGVPAFSQINPETRLHGISKTGVRIQVEIEDFEAARNCGIAEASLDAAVRLPLSRNGFSVPPSAINQLFVWVLISDGLENNRCAVMASLDFRRPLMIIPTTPDDLRLPLNSEDVIFGAEVWRAGRLLYGPSAEMGRRVNDAFEDFTEEWIAKWLIDNPQ